MPLTPAQRDELIAEGAAARAAGAWPGDCPHPHNSFERHWWLDGFRQHPRQLAITPAARNRPSNPEATDAALPIADGRQGQAEEEGWLARLARLLRSPVLVPVAGSATRSAPRTGAGPQITLAVVNGGHP